MICKMFFFCKLNATRVALKPLWLFLCLVLLGCKENIESFGGGLEIADTSKESQPLSKFFRIKSVLHLEDTEENYLAEIDKIDFFEDKVILLDRFVNSTVSIFSKSNGDFLFFAGYKGQGPGGFDFPYDFLIDKAAREIWVLTFGRINRYSISDGSFIGDIKIDLPLIRLHRLNENVLVGVQGRQMDQLVTLNNQFEIIASKLPYKGMHSMLAYLPISDNQGHPTTYLRNFDNQIYSISEKGNIQSYLRLDFGDKDLDTDQAEKIQDPREVTEVFTDRRLAERYFLESNDYLTFGFNQRKKTHLYFLNKENGRHLVFDAVDVDNDLTFDPYFPFILGINSNGNLIGYTLNKIDLKSNILERGQSETSESITLVEFEMIF